ncbi:hypothetical protein MASR2M15_04400 [Anaerolineales bacterium]
MRAYEWVLNLEEPLSEFIHSLQVGNQSGHYRLMHAGLSPIGEKIALSASCFAHKTAYTIGLWQQLSLLEQNQWNEFIRSFQSEGNPLQLAFGQHAFIDFPIYEDTARRLKPQLNWRGKLKQAYRQRFQGVSNPYEAMANAILISETKQALAGLMQVGAQAKYPYQAFPQTELAIKKFLKSLNWAQPWEAGGRAASLAVLLVTQIHAHTEALQQLRSFYAQIADPASGAYFIAPQRPETGILINGAMKVLTALDWLDERIHYPEALIDTTLSAWPQSEGCHLVDAVYVLYRASRESQHRRKEIQTYIQEVMKMIQAHWVADQKAFSYYTQGAQTHYYGVEISQGLSDQADLHGTVLLTWALAMCFDILEDENLPQWSVLRP